MKFLKILFLFLLFVLLADFSFAAGTCTVPEFKPAAYYSLDTDTAIAHVVCTGDASDGSFPAAGVPIYGLGGIITTVYYYPGSTAPTDLVDFVLELGSTGIAMLNGAGTDLSATAGKIMRVVDASGDPFIAGTTGHFNLKITNQAVLSGELNFLFVINIGCQNK